MNRVFPQLVHLRDYNRIYTGTNQNDGYDTPFLGFLTDTALLTLKADKSTYFHFPTSAPQMSLSATDLIESGGFAGSIPYKSDRIFKKQANYKKHVPWGDSIPENQQRGTWVCAWLSGNDANPSQQPIWMDRWYKPGRFDFTNTVFMSSTSAVYDTPSQMTFDPGVWYRYDHMGDTTNQTIVDSICGILINIDKWSQISLDVSGYKNNLTINNYTDNSIGTGVNPDEKPDDNSYSLGGNFEYGQILFSDTFNIKGPLTCNLWVQSSNWRNQSSHHFISNGFRGGWSIGFNNGFYTPIISIIDRAGNMIFTNQYTDFYKDIVLPGSPEIVSTGVDSQLYNWVLDNGIYDNNKHLYKIDINGNVERSVNFPTNIQLYDVVIDESDRAWVSNDQGVLSAFDGYCKLVATTSMAGKKLTITSQNVISAFNAIDACVFEDANYFTINNQGDVYLNNVLHTSGLSATNIQCTKDNIWVLFDKDKILRLDKSLASLTQQTIFVFGISAQIPDTISGTSTGRNIFFTNEFDSNSSNDYVWIIQPNTNFLYKYDNNLNYITKINATYVKNYIRTSAVMGDTSGYQWHRTFNYSKLKATKTPQIEANVYLGTGSPLISGSKYKTVLPISSLSVDGWHMFTLSVDTNNNLIKLYNDNILFDTLSIPASSSIYYKYKTPLILGTNVGQIVPLDEEIKGIKGAYHIGGYDDLRIYNVALNNTDIRHIFLTKFDINDLLWNIPTGLRSYTEEISRFFKFKMPGQKSQYYNIHLNGLQIENIEVREIIENIIKDSLKKISPLYTSLYKIIWD